LVSGKAVDQLGREQNMKLKQWIKYLVYIVVIYFTLVLRAQLDALFRFHAGQTYQFLKYGAIYWPPITLITMLIGALLGMDHILVHRKRAGKWHVNWPKLILLGVPSLALSLYQFVFFVGFINALMPLYRWLGLDGGFVAIFQMILGYVITTSFYKKEPASRIEPAVV